MSNQMSPLPYSPDELAAPVCPQCGVKHWARAEHRYRWEPKEVISKWDPEVIHSWPVELPAEWFKRPILHAPKRKRA